MCCRKSCRGCRRNIRTLRIELRETQTKLLIEELTRGELDAVMLALPVEDADDRNAAAVRRSRSCWRCRRPTRGRRAARVDARDIDQQRLILLEEGHCLRDQALAFCASREARSAGEPRRDSPRDRDADGRERLRRDAAAARSRSMSRCATSASSCCASPSPSPAARIGLAWRRTSPRRRDFAALGNVITGALGPRRSVETLSAKAQSRARVSSGLDGRKAVTGPSSG